MSKRETPAGSTGGPVPVPVLDDLPEKMRVHALARLLGRTSREVLAVLADVGVEARSAQSSIDRKAAEQVVTALTAGADEPAAAPAEPRPVVAEPVIAEPVDETPVTESFLAETTAAPAAAAPETPLVPLFAPPTPLFQEPTRPARTRRRKAEPEVAPPVAEPEAEAVEEPEAAAEVETDDADDDGARRRRRRGRRGRGRGRGMDDEGGDGDESDETADGPTGETETSDASPATDDSGGESEDDDESEDESSGADGDSAGSRRRRRRRRRRGSGDDGDSADEADPPNTVVRVRQPREPRESRSEAAAETGDGVQSVRGSTRLEAKRQRRRDGRDAGRRRVPILSEAEFLARRESVDRTMVVRERGDRVEIGVLEDDVLVEHFVAGRDGGSMVGNIYLGRVQNVLPSMEAAFVDIGRGRNAVLYAGEVDWDAAGLGGKARRIEQALSSGDPVLVQVTKDPIGHKGARLTTQISLAGRFLVYVPSGGAAGISRKLPDVERKRLKDMLKEIVPSEAGVIIRTASEGVSHEALERDVRRLQAQWEVVKAKSEQTGPNKPKAPVLLYEEPDLLIKVVRDQFNEDFTRLVIEGDDAWDTLQNYIGHVAGELGDRLHRHVGPKDVFAEYRIDEQLLKALDRKVWLPSGGTLVIDRTEAMTVIDVNTGKYTGSGGNLEETVTRNNLEAAEEVVRQLRLRDVGGIIVIDFIDMVLEANRDLVLRRLTECLARDRTRHQVAEVTSLGLVQMTRKRVGGGLLEHFSTPCEHCRGRGVMVSVEPVTESDNGRGGGNDRSDRSDRPEREASGRRSRGGRGRSAASAPAPVVEDEAPIVAAPEAAAVADAPLADVPVADVPVPDAPMTDAPSVDVPAADVPAVVVSAVEVPVVDVPVVTSPEASAEVPASVDTGVAAASPVDAAADAVEEIVVERSIAELAAEHGTDGADGGSVNGRNGKARAPRRRGRVTRTAGAPEVAGGEPAAVTVVTIPAPAPASDPVGAPNAEADGTAMVPEPTPQPEPTTVTRPRRTRRAASRPAGPPAADAVDSGESAETDRAGGDPV